MSRTDNNLADILAREHFKTTCLVSDKVPSKQYANILVCQMRSLMAFYLWLFIAGCKEPGKLNPIFLALILRLYKLEGGVVMWKLMGDNTNR